MRAGSTAGGRAGGLGVDGGGAEQKDELLYPAGEVDRLQALQQRSHRLRELFARTAVGSAGREGEGGVGFGAGHRPFDIGGRRGPTGGFAAWGVAVWNSRRQS